MYEAVIGLEVHVQLKTATKIFCRCPNRFGAEPNTLICPVCLGYPGTLPVPNREAVDLAVKLAYALDCEVHETSVFARKNYFYPDLPKGYQISQFDRPVAEWGRLPLSHHDREVVIRRLHLEEDAGKLLHETPGGGPLPNKSLVDFNRCGVPLVEVVSEPVMSTPEEAQDYLQTLHQVLLYTDTSDANMEEGSLRCDANVSVRLKGRTELGKKTEVKNLNSFRNVARALEYEIERQVLTLESGGHLTQETRSFDAVNGTTLPLRSKEEAHDYRYFPEPDLEPLILGEERLRALRLELPELPWARHKRFCQEYNLSPNDASVLTSSRELANYFEAAARAHPTNPKAIANWIMTDVLHELKERKASIEQALPAERLASLVSMVDRNEISNSVGKEVLGVIWDSGEEPEAVVERKGLGQIRDQDQIRSWVESVIAENPSPVTDFHNGRKKALGFLMGQVMRRSGGRAEPQKVQRLLLQVLETSTHGEKAT